MASSFLSYSKKMHRDASTCIFLLPFFVRQLHYVELSSTFPLQYIHVHANASHSCWMRIVCEKTGIISAAKIENKTPSIQFACTALTLNKSKSYLIGTLLWIVTRPPGMGKSYHVHVNHTHKHHILDLFFFVVLIFTSSLWLFSWFWFTLFVSTLFLFLIKKN